MRKAGIHGVEPQGIWSRKGIGAGSIVLNGGYPDDADRGDTILYTGAGGQDRKTKKQIADQSFEYAPNAALDLNRRHGLPVRVIRGWKGDGESSPATGFRYDGLYRVVDSWLAHGSAPDTSAFKMVTFLLERIDEGSPAPYERTGEEGPGERRGRLRTSDAEANRAVERRAIEVATSYLQSLGYEVEDVGVPWSPYDLRAIRGDEEIHVEVKGRVQAATTVNLTRREVDAARNYPDSALAVIDEIVLERRSDGPSASGGRLRLWTEWHPEDPDLKPTSFDYRLPPDTP